MKNIYLYLFLILIFNCKSEKSITTNESSIVKEKVTHFEQGITKKNNVESDSTVAKETQDCIFDQTTQTDYFLKNIKELEGYVWNEDSKRADIILNDHWNLSITRGGCDSFQFSAHFFYERILDLEKDKVQIFDQIIWITSLLKDFKGKKIEKAIKENKVSITKEDEFNYYANFIDSELYELYYFNFNNKDVTTFEIGYYYD